MTKKKMPSQTEFVKEWFIKRADRDISHEESKAGIEDDYLKITKKRFEDVDRTIRKLAQIGFLIKIKKGWYRYDPKKAKVRNLEDFSAADKKIILKRDEYKCVICGKGAKEGIDLQVDHIKPKELGGTATISNGQTLCASHNFRKKISSQTETGKKMFIRLLESVKDSEDQNASRIEKFCEEILKVYDKHDIDGHIDWKKKKY
jgi:predicted restriction endonuclease